MWFVYVVRSEVDGRFYVGMTQNVEKRIKEHNLGKAKSTKGYTPWTLFFFEEIGSRTDAREREKYLKGGSGKEYIKSNWLCSSTG